jgi:hypothetical protein
MTWLFCRFSLSHQTRFCSRQPRALRRVHWVEPAREQPRVQVRGPGMKRIAHLLALSLVIVAAYESQAAKAYGEEQAIQTTPAKPTTTVSSVISSRQPGSRPEWLLIVPPEQPRPFGQTRAMTEAPLSQWMVTETFPTAADCDGVLHPRRSPQDTHLFIRSTRTTPTGLQCIASDDPRLKH